MARRSFLQLVTGREASEEENYEKYQEVLTGQPATAASKDKRLKVSYDNEEVEPGTAEAPAEEGQLTIDVYQTMDEMVIKSTIAGVRQEDLDITIAADMVTIQGHRKKDESISPDDYYYQELYWGSFSRSVILPQEIDTESAKASLKDGILTIRLPKFERGRTKKLRINSV